MARTTAFIEMKNRKASEWRRLIKAIECPAMRGKVASLAFWDLFNKSKRRAPYILRSETRKFTSVDMECCISEACLKAELIKIGYPEYYANKRCIIPIKNNNNSERKMNEIRQDNHPDRTSGLCAFMQRRSGTYKRCVGSPPVREGGPGYDSKDNEAGGTYGGHG